MSSPSIEKGPLILPAAVESGGVKYDICIEFHNLDGRRIDAKMPVNGLSQEIGRIVQGCFDSLQKQLAQQGRKIENLEELGFYVESGAGSGGQAARTAALVAEAGQTVFQFLQEGGEVQGCEEGRVNTKELKLDSETVSEINGDKTSSTVHEELLHLQGLFQHDFILGTKSSSLGEGEDETDEQTPVPMPTPKNSSLKTPTFAAGDSNGDDTGISIPPYLSGAFWGSKDVCQKRWDVLNEAFESFLTTRQLGGMTLEQFLKGEKELPELDKLCDELEAIAYPFFEDLWELDGVGMDEQTASCREENDGSKVTQEERKAYALQMFRIELLDKLEKQLVKKTQ